MPCEDDLEDGGVREAAGWPHDLHHLFERHVAVFLRREHLGPGPAQQLRHRRPSFELQANGQRIDEEANQRLGLRSRAPRHGRADHHLVLPCQAPQEGRPARQESHVQGRPVTPRERLQSSTELGVEHHFHRIPRVVLLRRSDAVAR